MSDRFDKLMYQAGITAQGCWDEMDGYDRDAILNFAELIVRECQDRVEHYIRDCGEINSLPDTVIMKHFGVE